MSMNNERFTPLGQPNIDSDSPDGTVIRFSAGTWGGGVIARLYDDDGRLLDALTGHSFFAAYDTAREQWPNATWTNREEE